ncbi:hypothetical protein GOD37_14800 [Sinorhizobium medicae]|nr:hypothetical protein [Sinorhizobium medicae]
MGNLGTFKVFYEDAGKSMTFDERAAWEQAHPKEPLPKCADLVKRNVIHGAPITQEASRPKSAAQKTPSLNEADIVEAVGRLVGEVKRDLVDRIDELAKERRDGLDDIHHDYQNVKNDIDHAVHSKIADALRLERQKRATIELRLERALDDIEKLKQQMNGARLYEVARAK